MEHLLSESQGRRSWRPGSSGPRGWDWILGLGSSRDPGHCSSSTLVILLVLLLAHSHVSTPQTTCPTACECMWKSGKESVVCSERAGFRTIPKGLSPDTQVRPYPHSPHAYAYLYNPIRGLYINYKIPESALSLFSFHFYKYSEKKSQRHFSINSQRINSGEK